MAVGITIPAKDKYDVSISYLRKHPTHIVSAWENWSTHPAGCLFQIAEANPEHSDLNVGCLTEIRRLTKLKICGRPDLTEEIKIDDRIPTKAIEVSVEHLHVFAEWQRRLDKELQRA